MSRTSPLPWLRPGDPPDAFPAPEQALAIPDGLLAAGGDLSVQRLLCAYRRGIFPWFEQGQPILWWSPDPRAVLRPADLHISRSLAKRLRRGDFEVRVDSDFAAVIDGCAAPRTVSPGTWITPPMRAAYLELHRLGHAHSVEVWRKGRLSGGLYGVAIGRVFFGESMFSRERDMSKIALVQLVRELEARDFALIDCQMATAHLQRLGSRSIARAEFLRLLDTLCEPAGPAARWQVLAR